MRPKQPLLRRAGPAARNGLFGGAGIADERRQSNPMNPVARIARTRISLANIEPEIWRLVEVTFLHPRIPIRYRHDL